MTLQPLAPEDARRARDELVTAMTKASLVAHVVSDPDYVVGFLDFPLSGPGPSYAWTGGWRKEADLFRTPPIVTVGTSAISNADVLRARMLTDLTGSVSEMPHIGLPAQVTLAESSGRFVGEFVTDMAYVLVVSNASGPRTLTISLLEDRRPVIARMVRASGNIPEP